MNEQTLNKNILSLILIIISFAIFQHTECCLVEKILLSLIVGMMLFILMYILNVRSGKIEDCTKKIQSLTYFILISLIQIFIFCKDFVVQDTQKGVVCVFITLTSASISILLCNIKNKDH